MRTELETRLKQLPAPDAPTNLKARCLQTVPAEVQRARAKPRGFGRLFSAPKLGLATLVLATAIGLAFWNTRPVANKSASVGGNVAFAQTVEAMKNVTYLRTWGWNTDRDTDTPASRIGKRRMVTIEFDLARGAYVEGSTIPIRDEVPLVKGDAAFERALYLPNGVIYERHENSKILEIRSDQIVWDILPRYIKHIVSGIDASSVLVTSGAQQQHPKLVSSAEGVWKGKQVNVYVFREMWPDKTQKEVQPEDLKSASEEKLYVDPKTKLIVARQSFIIFRDGSRNQENEMEFDYTRPNPSLFDPAHLKIGAQIVDKRDKK